MNKKKIIGFFMGFLQLINSAAQDSYRAVHWDVENGLSNGIVNCTLKDNYGFLWIGTSYGLSRFDGNTFKNYFAAKNSPFTIPDNNIKKLVEDSLHNIWIGSLGGISRYDIRTDSFTHFLPANPANLNAAILPFGSTRDEIICLESNSHVTAYNIHSLVKKTLINLSPVDDVGYGMAILYSIFDAVSNSVWMLEGRPDIPGGGLYRISLSDGKREHYKWNCYKNIPNHSHASEAMCFDAERNALWINSPDGLIEFTMGDRQFHFTHVLDELVNLKNYDRYVGIDLDPHGRVWLATKPKGIILYDPAKQSMTFPLGGDSILENQVANGNLSLYCDKEGMVWSGFYNLKGLYQLIPFSQTVIQYRKDKQLTGGLSDNTIINCVNGGKGKLWMGTLNGLNIFDPVAGLFQVFNARDLPGLEGRVIIPAGVDTIAQKAWLHTEKGFFEMDMLNNNCRDVIFKDTGFNQIINPQIVDPLWYGGYCQFKNGCIIPAVFDGQLGIFQVSSDSAIAHQILQFPGKMVLYGSATGNDKYLFLKGLEGTTLTYFYEKGRWSKISTSLDNLKRHKIICSEKDSGYWVMSETELWHFDKSFKIIHKYTQKDGLPYNAIYSIKDDSNGDLWFTTDRNISKLNVKTGKITTLSEREGFQKQYFSPGACIIKDYYGDLYFASGIQSNQGFARVTPGKLRETYPPSVIYLKSIVVNQNDLPVSNAIISLDKLSLKYFQNNLSIETGIIDFYSNGTDSIRYKLDGINDNWQYAPANYTIRYDGLPPGKYELVMQASNAAGDFNGPEKILFVGIQPPFWQTWWFISLAVILVFIGIYLLFQFRLKQKMQVLNVRQKLHRDLHDDVGATLSSIKVYSEVLQNNTDKTLIAELIKHNAEDMIDKLEIIAWATNPKHDSFKSFKDLVTKYASSVCYSRNIEPGIKCGDINDNMMMPGDVRQNLLLIFKEAINNTIKYSEASCCSLDIYIRGNKFYFTIADNGKGYNGAIQGNGNGWKNMQKRAQELNGSITIESSPGKGTIIRLSLPYPFKIPNLWDNRRRTL